MTKRNKNNPVGKPAKRQQRTEPEKRSASSTPQFTLNITASITPLDKDIIESKMIEIKLPITLNDLACDIANISFSLAEELAFKTKIEFLPANELKIDGQISDEDIPF
jgi:hypothetical protein